MTMTAFFNQLGVLTAGAEAADTIADTTAPAEVIKDATYFEQQLANLGDACMSIAFRLIAAAIVFALGSLLIRFLIRHFPDGKRYRNIDITVRKFVRSFLQIVLYILLLISVIAIMGVPMSSVVAVIASAGVTIGLALQGSLSNLAGGIMILMFKPFRVGDFIEGDGTTGTVEEVSLFYTVLRNPTNQRINVPNSALSNTKVVNYSVYDTRRLDIDFTVAYGTDKNAVIETIMAVVDADAMALKDPAPFLRMTQHADSALVFTLRVWCGKADFFVLKSNLLEEVNEAFLQHGIEIPYKTIDVNVNNKA